MYEIYIGETLVETTVKPNYCYYDTRIESFRSCEEPQAEAILINQQISEEEFSSYFADIDYKSARHEGFPIARIVKINEA